MSPKRPGSEIDRRDRRGVWYAVIGLVVLLGGLYVAGHFLLGNRLPTGTRIGGVGVGGLTPEEAEERLAADLGPRTKKKLTFYFENREFTIEPDEVGLDLRIEESVDKAGGGRTWNPVRMLETAVGADRIDPVVAADGDRLRARIDDIAGEVDIAAAEPRVEFRHKKMKVRRPEAGRELQRAELEKLIRDEFTRERQPIPLPVAVDKPAVTGDEFDTAIRERVRVAVGSPVKVRAGSRSFQLSGDAVKSMLRYVSDGGKLTAKIDEDRFQHLVRAKTEDFRRPPEPATVVLRNGSPKAVAAEPGRGIETDRASGAVIQAIEQKSAKKRVIRLDVKTLESDFHKSDAQKLGINRRVSSYVAGYPKSQYSKQRRTAELVDGAVLRPGQVFSFNRAVGGGRRSLADVSPVATGVFNAAFLAGMRTVERHPHNVYSDHFPAGRDAMVIFPSSDLRFKNDTKYGVLVNAWVELRNNKSGKVHVELWSTRQWKIEASKSKRRHVQKPGVRYEKSKRCVPRAGASGFDIDVTRTFFRDGKRVRRDSLSSSYDPVPRVRCRRR